jgi:hypothetical protein
MWTFFNWFWIHAHILCKIIRVYVYELAELYNDSYILKLSVEVLGNPVNLLSWTQLEQLLNLHI